MEKHLSWTAAHLQRCQVHSWCRKRNIYPTLYGCQSSGREISNKDPFIFSRCHVTSDQALLQEGEPILITLCLFQRAITVNLNPHSQCSGCGSGGREQVHVDLAAHHQPCQSQPGDLGLLGCLVGCQSNLGIAQWATSPVPISLLELVSCTCCVFVCLFVCWLG